MERERTTERQYFYVVLEFKIAVDRQEHIKVILGRAEESAVF